MIDDEPNILKMMKLWFEDSDVDLCTAGTAQKGLEAIRQERYDVILCDFGMDDMNGLEVGKAHQDLCRIAGIPKTPFMLLTGLDTQLDTEALRLPVSIGLLKNRSLPITVSYCPGNGCLNGECQMTRLQQQMDSFSRPIN